jgi:hypothetical protein
VQKAKALAALGAAADPVKGGQAMRELCHDPQFLLEREISRLRAQAIARGEAPPMYYRIELFPEPTRIRYPGRMRRYRDRKAKQP